MQYYVIEGIDTSGKTTQYNLIKQHYPCVSLSDYKDSQTQSIILLNEPGGTAFGNLIREILLHKQVAMADRSAFLLFLAQRAEIFERIKDLPNTIIADRSLISGIAYAHTIDMHEALRLNLFATQSILPHKIVLLELSEATLKERLGQKQLDNIESKGIHYLMDIQERLKTIITYLQNSNTMQDLGYCNPNRVKNIDSAYNAQTQQPEVLRLDAALPQEIIHNYICAFFGI